jgi:hypothetical protein
MGKNAYDCARKKEDEMTYLIYALFVVFIVMVLLFSGSRGSAERSQGRSSQGAMQSVQAAEAQPSLLTRDEVHKKLLRLSSSPPPANLKQGACCYKMASPPNRGEFICPKCGERTLYATDSKDGRTDGRLIGIELPECRRLVGQIRGLDVKLDETEFCKRCSPASTSPRLILLIKYKGDALVHRFKGVTSEDLAVLKEFLDGKDRHSTFNEAEIPLSRYSERLSTMLDLKK